MGGKTLNSKTCNLCGGTPPLENFMTHPESKDGYRNTCRVCWNKRRVGMKLALGHKYGIKKKDFDRMSANQKHRCAICQLKVLLCVDHDHETNKIRGLICKKCNFALGLVGDNTITLERMVRYLKRHQQKSETLAEDWFSGEARPLFLREN